MKKTTRSKARPTRRKDEGSYPGAPVVPPQCLSLGTFKTKGTWSSLRARNCQLPWPPHLSNKTLSTPNPEFGGPTPGTKDQHPKTEPSTKRPGLGQTPPPQDPPSVPPQGSLRRTDGRVQRASVLRTPEEESAELLVQQPTCRVRPAVLHRRGRKSKTAKPKKGRRPPLSILAARCACGASFGHHGWLLLHVSPLPPN